MRKPLLTISGLPFWDQKQITNHVFSNPHSWTPVCSFYVDLLRKQSLWGPFQNPVGAKLGLQISKWPPNASKNSIWGKLGFKWFWQSTQGIIFIVCWCKIRLSMPLFEWLFIFWGNAQSPVSRIRGTFLVSFHEPWSTNMDAKYLHRELAENVPETAKSESSPQNLRDIL